jgi:hypothetical protein
MSKRLNLNQKSKVQRHHYSSKMNMHFYVDSKAEQDIATAYEFTTDIVGYKSQPFSTLYTGFDGGKHRYTPDFLIENQAGEFTLVEVKPEKRTKSTLFEAEFALLRRHVNERYDVDLVLYTEKSYSKQFFKNSLMLNRYLRKPVTSEQKGLLKRLGYQQYAFGELKEFIIAKRLDLFIAFQFVAHQICKMDFSTEVLCDETVLEIEA